MNNPWIYSEFDKNKDLYVYLKRLKLKKDFKKDLKQDEQVLIEGLNYDKWQKLSQHEKGKN
jgi:hypothetical protein